MDGALQYPDFNEPVIVVGGGLAGLSATLEAYNEGASVILVEGERSLGGNSAKVNVFLEIGYFYCFSPNKDLSRLQASSGMAACNTEAQRVRNISDSTDLFYSDTMASGDRENDPSLVDVLVSPLFDMAFLRGQKSFKWKIC